MTREEVEFFTNEMKKVRVQSQEHCEDVVSRTEITDELNRLGRNAFKDDTDYDNFFAFLYSLPHVTPTQKWNTTPPTKNTYDILLSSKAEDGESHVWMGCYEDGHYYYADGIIDVDNEVIAWMPAPEPYKAEMEGEE